MRHDITVLAAKTHTDKVALRETSRERTPEEVFQLRQTPSAVVGDCTLRCLPLSTPFVLEAAFQKHGKINPWINP